MRRPLCARPLRRYKELPFHGPTREQAQDLRITNLEHQVRQYKALLTQARSVFPADQSSPLRALVATMGMPLIAHSLRGCSGASSPSEESRHVDVKIQRLQAEIHKLAAELEQVEPVTHAKNTAAHRLTRWATILQCDFPRATAVKSTNKH